MVKRQAKAPAPGTPFPRFAQCPLRSDVRKGPVSAIAARKAKQNLFGGAAISKASQLAPPTNQDKENHGVPPPAKKQKIEPPTQSSGPDPPKKKMDKPKVRLPLPPLHWSSQSSAQSTGSRDSPIIIDKELPDEGGASKKYDDAHVRSEEKIFGGGEPSGTEESEIGDSE